MNIIITDIFMNEILTIDCHHCKEVTRSKTNDFSNYL